MLIYPAIDLREGKVVRLARGDFDAATVYGTNPVDVAAQFARAGAQWVHVVDLDGAAGGEPVQTEIVHRIAAVDGIRVQTGGGIRSLEDAKRVLAAGADRIVVGTAAVDDPDLLDQLLREMGRQVAVGIDAAGGVAATDGWRKSSGDSAESIGQRAVSMGVSRLIVTDIATDGMLAGPGLDLLRTMVKACGVPVIASGGVATMGDVEALAAIPEIEGVIIGRAIYEGKIDIATVIEKFQT